jgi:hypothetical protein
LVSVDPARDRDGAVDDDSEEPGLEGTVGVAAIDVFENGQERIGHDVFGGFRVSCDVVRRTERTELIALHQSL